MVQPQYSTPAHSLQPGPQQCVTLQDERYFADIHLEILRWEEVKMETWVGLIQSYGYLQGKQEGQSQKTTEAEVRGA